jgi:hypothetical protein
MIELSPNMKAALATIADAKAGEISGWSVATWLGHKKHPEGISESLRALTNRGLIMMRPMDDPPRQFPDRLKAMYSIRKETHQRISSLTEQRDAAKAELAAMTADRNLYRDDHDGEDHPYSEVVALKAENDRLRAALKNGEEMYIAMRDRCARTEAALNKATGPEGSAK